MQRQLLLLPILSLILANSACTALKRPAGETILDETKQSSKQTKRANSSNIESQLLATAQSIEQSLTVLAAAEKAESPPILNTEPLTTQEGGMGGIVDIDWTGPIGPLVEKIATMTNYRVKFLGNEPAIPILITISTKQAIIADVLQNASLQAGKRAHILVFPNNRVIEVRYLS